VAEPHITTAFYWWFALNIVSRMFYSIISIESKLNTLSAFGDDGCRKKGVNCFSSSSKNEVPHDEIESSDCAFGCGSGSGCCSSFGCGDKVGVNLVVSGAFGCGFGSGCCSSFGCGDEVGVDLVMSGVC
jgi:hypothetical protein